jgi:hypothetical protein
MDAINLLVRKENLSTLVFDILSANEKKKKFGKL